MKNNFFEKWLPLLFLFLTLLFSGYLYKEGAISLFLKSNPPKGIKFYISEIPFKNKQYNLSYRSRPASDVLVIFRFEDNENWVREGDFDYSTYIEGRSSLNLTSQNGSLSTARLTFENKLNLGDFQDLAFFVYFKTPPENIEKLNLILENGNKYEYQISPEELVIGWNFLKVPKENFTDTLNDIGKASLELISKPDTISSVNFDLLLARKNKSYLNDWLARNLESLLLVNNNNELNLLLVTHLNTIVTLKEITSVKDFSFATRFTPLSEGSFGLFIRGNYLDERGYYFVLNGVGTNFWEIFKKVDIDQKQKILPIVRGAINNYFIEKNVNYWLKVKTKGSKFAFYISKDGENFVKLGEAKDSSYISGTLGFTGFQGAIFLADDIKFEQ